MRNTFLFPALGLVLGVTACSRSDTYHPQSRPCPVTFGSYVARTRVPSLQSGNLQDFGTFAYYTGNETWHPAAVPNFMYNQKVEGSAPDGFSYSPLKYWPSSEGASLSFFAYAPYGTAANGITVQTGPADSGAPQIKYAVPASEADQVDLLVSAPVYDATLRGSEGTIHFQFQHRLARIGFQAALAESGYEGTTLYLNNISLTAAYPASGVLDLANGQWSEIVTGRSRTLVRDFGAEAEGRILTAARQEMQDGNGYLMVIPTGEENEYTLSVTYTLVTQDPALSGGRLTYTNTFSSVLSLTTEAGRSYLLNLIVSPTAITFDQPEVGVWTDGGGENVTLP